MTRLSFLILGFILMAGPKICAQSSIPYSREGGRPVLRKDLNSKSMQKELNKKESKAYASQMPVIVLDAEDKMEVVAPDSTIHYQMPQMEIASNPNLIRRTPSVPFTYKYPLLK